MGLTKCPRCEVNYISGDEKYCNVCKRYMTKGQTDAEEAPAVCSECGENPAVRGSELCAICLREARRQLKLADADDDANGTAALSISGVELDGIEVPMPAEGEIPESELDEIDKELGDDDDEDDDDIEDDGDIMLDSDDE